MIKQLTKNSASSGLEFIFYMQKRKLDVYFETEEKILSKANLVSQRELHGHTVSLTEI